MRIEDMFDRRIDRPIKGVIKVGQGDELNIYQELDEYVVTKELSKHFRDFFENYEKGISGTTDKMGVWISGFFGSGKSHFLKILSYILRNCEIESKRAVDFFTDGKKIQDQTVIANMIKAGNVTTDVMLFNIDSKGSAKVGSSKEAIIEVFMKVFNEMQGFCGSMPYLADFERQLAEEGVFEDFQVKFKEITGCEWEKKRQSFSMIQDKVVKTIVSLNLMSEDAAKNWCKTARSSYDLSIEKFVGLVKQYCDKKGPKHHVVFLVDEIGQYIADDVKLMLNLQTIVEDLGTACQGRAWVIVTSQQDIDSITKTKGNDFSKIIGRFDTKLSLSSANVDEVIRKRILAKNETAKQTLRLLYDKNEAIIKNLITFTSDTSYKELYENRDDFSAVYPFIPYQVNLLGQVLTSIRTHGASGKHLAEGERSMLALFQESAIHFKEYEEGLLIPFNIFYNALDKFIDHTHRTVILQAADNPRLNDFDVELLKVLFMIKYVKEIKANIDNLTTLMVSSFDQDRITLRKRVVESLQKLILETLVQKNGDIYIFLTNEEQEINNAINNETVEMAEIINEAQTVIFEEIYKEKKYRYSNRYMFAFNQKVDDWFFKGNQSNDIGVHIITPYGTDYTDSALRILSVQQCNIIVKLPNDSTFLDEISENIKITKFINKNAGGAAKNYDSIRRAKEDERLEKKDRIKIFIEDSLKNADIYVNGEKANIGSKDPSSRINEALGRLVATRYNKLSYMETAPGLSDIAAIFDKENRQTNLPLGIKTPNKLALDEVIETISLNNSRHMKTSLKSLLDRFLSAPYGFVAEDVEWLTAMLFKLGRISFTVNSQSITLVDNETSEIVRYLTKRDYVEKILIDIKEIPEDRLIKSAKEILRDYLGYAVVSDDTDVIMKNFKSYARSKSDSIEKILVEYRISKHYPGKTVVIKAKKLLDEVIAIKEPLEFYKVVDKHRDDFIDDAEDIAPVLDFFNGEQKTIFEKAWKCIDIYNRSKTYIVDKDLISVAKSIMIIAENTKPYSEIYKLPALIESFNYKNIVLLGKEAECIRPELSADKETVMNKLNTAELTDYFKIIFEERFNELIDKLTHSNEIAVIKNIRLESDAIKIRCLDEIAEYEFEHGQNPEPPIDGGGVEKPPVTPPVNPIKFKKNISMRNITGGKTYSFETEEEVNRFIEEIRDKLLKELKEDTIVSLN